MENNTKRLYIYIYIYIYMYIYIWWNHFAIQQKPTQHYKSNMIQ